MGCNLKQGDISNKYTWLRLLKNIFFLFPQGKRFDFTLFSIQEYRISKWGPIFHSLQVFSFLDIVEAVLKFKSLSIQQNKCQWNYSSLNDLISIERILWLKTSKAERSTKDRELKKRKLLESVF